MRIIKSREYKLIIEHGPFADRAAAVRRWGEALDGLGVRLKGLKVEGRFEAPESGRSILFLDTPSRAFRREGYVLRRREQRGEAEYTLKCRSEDRCFAAGADVREGEGFRDDPKFEEDVARPFRCRFSVSNTVRPDGGSRWNRGAPPSTVRDAAELFPALGSIPVDGGQVREDETVAPVADVAVFERVYEGPVVRFTKPRRPDGSTPSASLALIVWTEGPAGPPLICELSFRLKDKEGEFDRELSKGARGFFEAMTGLDGVRPEGVTKTGFLFGDGDGE